MHKKRVKLHLGVIVALLLVLATTVYFYVPQMFADTVYPLEYQSFIVKYCQQDNVDPALLSAIILQESRFNPNAVSGKGAQGLMQFEPGTAATMAKETGLYPNYNIFDPETSIIFGAAHIRDMLIKYNGSVDLALYAYNTGTGNADKYANDPAAIANYSYVVKIKNYRQAYATIYATELDVAPVKIEKVDNTAQVRGFVWSQIFSNLWNGLGGNKS